ncbi:hypothetical protein YC2023_105983 [Brassica napus]
MFQNDIDLRMQVSPSHLRAFLLHAAFFLLHSSHPDVLNSETQKVGTEIKRTRSPLGFEKAQ